MNRWNSLNFKNGKSTKNRIVVPPMASQTADKKGFITEQTRGHYKKLTESGAGLIFVEYSHIHQSGKGEPNQLGADADNKIKGLKEISHIIKSSGALAGLQIVHIGGKGSSELTGESLLAPSNISVPMRNGELEVPTQMSHQQIQQMRLQYLDAARRASRAQFDIIELHAAHGYGLNQWLSPITNHRQDQYGGSIKNRARLLLEIVMDIKKFLPELLLAIRLPAQDYLPGGISIKEMSWLVRELELLGVDLIDVSSGLGGWRRPRDKTGQGYLIEDASALKKATNLPIIGVGGIKTGSFIDCLLVSKKIDFAAVGRAILENPKEWALRNIDESRKEPKDPSFQAC